MRRETCLLRIFAALLMLLFVQPVFPRNGVLQMTDGTPSDRTLNLVLSKACMIELERAGLRSFSSIPTIGDGSGTEMPDPQISGDALSFLLICRYEIRDGEITILLDFRSLPGGESLAREEFDRTLDLQLDTEVADVLRRMIDRLAIREERVREERVSPPKPGIAAPEPASPIGQSSDVLQFEPRTAAADPVPGGLAFGVQGAPVLIVGKASEYFRFSASAAAFVGYRFPFMEISVETGLLFGYLHLFPSQEVPDGSASLITAGFESRAGSATGAPVRLTARAGGGVALLTAESDAAEQSSKVLPYVAGGMGGGVLLGKRLTLGVEIGTIVVFERVHPIIGIVPSLSLSFGG